MNVLSWTQSDITDEHELQPLHTFSNLSAVFSIQRDPVKIIFGDGGGLIQVFDFSQALPKEWGSQYRSNRTNPLLRKGSGTHATSPSFTKQQDVDDTGKLEYSMF